MKGLVDWLVDI